MKQVKECDRCYKVTVVERTVHPLIGEIHIFWLCKHCKDALFAHYGNYGEWV